MPAFSGGDKLRSKLAEMTRRARSATSVNVGFLAGATYPGGVSVPMVAAIQEFGAPSRGIPPRPFFRSMVAKESPAWPVQLGKVLEAADYQAETALARMGEHIKGELQQSIVSLTDPPLAPATIRAKGFDKPLISSGVMLRSVDYEVIT